MRLKLGDLFEMVVFVTPSFAAAFETLPIFTTRLNIITAFRSTWLLLGHCSPQKTKRSLHGAFSNPSIFDRVVDINGTSSRTRNE